MERQTTFDPMCEEANLNASCRSCDRVTEPHACELVVAHRLESIPTCRRSKENFEELGGEIPCNIGEQLRVVQHIGMSQPISDKCLNKEKDSTVDVITIEVLVSEPIEPASSVIPLPVEKSSITLSPTKE